MLALGIDPGYATCGVALVAVAGGSFCCLDCATLRTPSSQPLEARLEAIWRGALPWFETLRLSDGALVGVEDQSGAQEGARGRGMASHEAQGVLRVEGILRALSWAHGAVVVPVAPQAVKRALGLPGTAPKAQVVRAVRGAVRGVPQRMSGHAADAICTAIAASRRAKLGQLARR